MRVKPAMTIRRVLCAALLLCAGAAQAQLTDTEQRIVAAVKQRSPQAIELLEKTVRVNSGTLMCPSWWTDNAPNWEPLP